MYLSATFSNELKSPTVESFIRETTKSNSLKGLAVYFNLTDACQALDEVSKIRTQVPKIALVTLVNESTCTSQGHPTTIFGRISVRKMILDLEFSEHLL